MDELKARLVEIETELRTEQYRGGDMNNAKIAALQHEYQDIQTQINQLEVQGISQAVAASIETFVVGDDTFTLVELADGPEAAEIIRIGLQKLEATMSEKATAWVNDLQKQKEEYEQRLADKDQHYQGLTAQNEELSAQVRTLQSDLSDVTTERDELKRRRDAAADELADAKKEIEQLKSWNDDLQKQIAVGAPGAHNVIEIKSDAEIDAIAQRFKAKKAAEAAEQAAKAEAAKIRIYELEWADLRHSVYNAKRADNDEPISFNYLQLSQYVVLQTPEELARFREEHKAQDHAPVVQPVEDTEIPSAPSQPVEIPTVGDGFHPAEETHDVGGVGGDTAQTDVVGQTVEERLAKLERRMDAIDGGRSEVAA